jgi:chromosome segregation ATPase
MPVHFGPQWLTAARSTLLASVALSWATIAVSGEVTDVQRTDQRPSVEDRLELAQAAEPEKRAPVAIGSAKADHDTRTFDELDTAASGLNDALAGAQAKLERLREATEMAALAAKLREELQASAEENNRLSMALTKAEAAQRSLVAGQESAEDEVAALKSALERNKHEADKLKQQLRESREKTTITDVARSAAEERADQAERQLAESRQQNDTLGQQIDMMKTQLVTVRREYDEAKLEIKSTRDERDEAHAELDDIRLRIAGLLRSVLHADESVEVDTTPQPTAEAEPTGQDADEQPYEIVRTSNVRSEPRPDSERVDIAIPGETVSVLRKIDADNWFEIETKRGVRGFIFGELIRPAT